MKEYARFIISDHAMADEYSGDFKPWKFEEDMRKAAAPRAIKTTLDTIQQAGWRVVGATIETTVRIPGAMNPDPRYIFLLEREAPCGDSPSSAG